jgi:BMFP domain-containing protein YqiC
MKINQRVTAAKDTAAGSIGNGLVWTLAQTVTGTIQEVRNSMERAVGGVASSANQVLGSLRDAGSDLFSYVEPGAWLEDVYRLLGIASSGSVGEIDERMDSVELRLDDVARQRAREELLVLRQRVGELEALLSDVRRGETFAAIETLIDRLSELEARVESLPGLPS